MPTLLNATDLNLDQALQVLNLEEKVDFVPFSDLLTLEPLTNICKQAHRPPIEYCQG